MKLHHVAIWAFELEAMKDFYVRYFGCTHKEKYVNSEKGFESYFLRFDDGSSMELMTNAAVRKSALGNHRTISGFAHIAISLGSKEKVIGLTDRLRLDGYPVVFEPRTTGDGYFESVVLDSEGNRIELTI
jgi:catechol 2,3-dioxygenase-like lactoylglutathione lyase family enzyme